MRKVFIFILFPSLCGMWSQVNSVSPYTIFGMGDLSEGYC